MSNPLAFARDRRRSEDGFTLIELLVVVVILGILIGIAIPVYLNYRKSANDKAAQSDVRGAVSTLEVCNSEGGYPISMAETGGAFTATTGCNGQTVAASTGTKFRYVTTPTSAAIGAVTSYIVYARNDGGSGKVYCYNSGSTTGGGVKDASGTALATATCPA